MHDERGAIPVLATPPRGQRLLAPEFDAWRSMTFGEQMAGRRFMAPRALGIDQLVDELGCSIDEAWAWWMAAIRLNEEIRRHSGSPLDERVEPADLLGPAELAGLLGVERSTIAQWRHRRLLPTPSLTLSGLDIWHRDDVLAWAQSTGRLQEAALFQVTADGETFQAPSLFDDSPTGASQETGDSVLGWLVALYEYGRWTDTWDGTIHTSRAAVNASADEAKAAGWEIRVCRLVSEHR